MNKNYANVCPRCGTERIVSKTWKEKVGNSVIINTQTICPDPACQKVVNSDNKKAKDKSKAIRLQSEERAANRKELKHIAKLAKDEEKSKKASSVV